MARRGVAARHGSRHPTRLPRFGHIGGSEITLRQATNAMRRSTSAGLKAAVHRSKALSRAGLLERLFTLAFRGSSTRKSGRTRSSTWRRSTSGRASPLAIASGSCNVLSYLMADAVTAVDLDGAISRSAS